MATVLEQPSVQHARPAARPLTQSQRPQGRPHAASRRFLSTDPVAGTLTGFAFVVSLVLLAVFGLDLAYGIPFRHASHTMDLGFVFSSAALAYLSWSTWRELK